MNQTFEVIFSPAEHGVLSERDLGGVVCVVFDVLRATTTMLTALANGAEAIIPVSEIPEALALKGADPGLLLAGERDGYRILAEQTGGVDFDLGNSPREFTMERVRGKRIVMSTTNGTRALRACAGAEFVLVAAFLNLSAIGRWIERTGVEHLVIVCSGTVDQAAYEDALGAGGLADLVWERFQGGQISDSAQMARELFVAAEGDLLGAVGQGRNGRRLLSRSELRDDVALCVARDTLDLVAVLGKDGVVRRMS